MKDLTFKDTHGRWPRKERPRVVYLINLLRYDGGTEAALAHTANAITKRGFDVWIAGLYGRGALRERLLLGENRTVFFSCDHGFFGTLTAVRQVSHFLRAIRADIVHAYEAEANLIGQVSARIAGVPATFSTEHLTYQPRSALHELLIDCVLARNATGVIAVAEAVRKAVSARVKLPRDRIIVIPNPLPLAEIPLLSDTQKRIKRAALKLDATQSVVIAIGRLEPEKGFPVLLEAAKAIVHRLPHTAFLIAGRGSMEAKLHELASDYGLDGAVHLLGSRRDVYELLQISDVLAMPSFSEGLPMVLLEAAGCRVPAVATSVGGVSEIITHGMNGFLVSPGDSAALARRVLELLSDPALRVRMGVAGHNIVKEKFSPARIAESLQNTYEHAVWTATDHY